MTHVQSKIPKSKIPESKIPESKIPKSGARPLRQQMATVVHAGDAAEGGLETIGGDEVVDA